MKAYYIISVVRPQNKESLVDGIHYYWENILTQKTIDKKIEHLHTVLKKAIIVKGKATGY